MQIAKINLRHNSIYHIAFAVFILFVTPVLFGVTNLDVRAAAVPLEMFVALIGIVLLSPVFQPEQNAEIADLVASKFISTSKVYLTRIAYSLIIIIVFILCFIFLMKINGSQVSQWMAFGTIAEATFLGSIGMVTAAAAGNTAIAYMTPLMFYALNFSAGSKMGNFYLFSMAAENYTPKIYLLIVGIILIIISLIIKDIQRKLH